MKNIVFAALASFALLPALPACSSTPTPERGAAQAATGRGTEEVTGAPDADRTPATCAGLDEAACSATAGCAAGYLGIADCSCPGPISPEGKAYEGISCADCGAGSHVFAACVRPAACEELDETACRANSLTCRPNLTELCDCACTDPEAASCEGCSASCRPFQGCATR